MEIKSGTFQFPVGTGERTQSMAFLFPQRVVEAHVALSGYHAEFQNEDRPIKRLKVMLTAAPGAHIDEGFEARVTVVFNMRDRNADDPYFGSVSFVLFALLKSSLPPAVIR